MPATAESGGTAEGMTFGMNTYFLVPLNQFTLNAIPFAAMPCTAHGDTRKSNSTWE